MKKNCLNLVVIVLFVIFIIIFTQYIQCRSQSNEGFQDGSDKKINIISNNKVHLNLDFDKEDAKTSNDDTDSCSNSIDDKTNKTPNREPSSGYSEDNIDPESTNYCI